jgi:acyl-CoA reductase-like NAD-dependent aldehyde dehydrogenase
MRKLTLLPALLVVALVVPAAFAGSPHFIDHSTSSSISGSSLVCNFKEAGLSAGSIETITCGANEVVCPARPSASTIARRLSGSSSATRISSEMLVSLPSPGRVAMLATNVRSPAPLRH